jgi:hypothetical protein
MSAKYRSAKYRIGYIDDTGKTRYFAWSKDYDSTKAIYERMKQKPNVKQVWIEEDVSDWPYH